MIPRPHKYLYRIPQEPLLGRVEGGVPWPIWYITGLRVSSPFLDLDAKKDAEIISLLTEAQEIEIEFEAIGRQMKRLCEEKWAEYRDLWKAALLCALQQREINNKQTNGDTN